MYTEGSAVTAALDWVNSVCISMPRCIIKAPEVWHKKCAMTLKRVFAVDIEHIGMM